MPTVHPTREQGSSDRVLRAAGAAPRGWRTGDVAFEFSAALIEADALSSASPWTRRFVLTKEMRPSICTRRHLNDGRRHRYVTAVASDHDRASEAGTTASATAHPRARCHHPGSRPSRPPPTNATVIATAVRALTPSPSSTSPNSAASTGADCLDEQHLSDRSMIQSDDERSRGDRYTGRKPNARTADRTAGLDHSASLDDRDIRGDRYRGE